MTTGLRIWMLNITENKPENCCEFATRLFLRNAVQPCNYRILWPVNYVDDKQMATTSPHEKTYSWKTKLCEHRMLALFLLSVFMLTGAGKLNNGRGGTQGQREEAGSGSLTDSRMRTQRDGRMFGEQPREDSDTDIITFVFQIGVIITFLRFNRLVHRTQNDTGSSFHSRMASEWNNSKNPTLISFYSNSRWNYRATLWCFICYIICIYLSIYLFVRFCFSGKAQLQQGFQGPHKSLYCGRILNIWELEKQT